MRARIRKLWFQLFRHRGFDILVTHAPAYQLNDGRDLPHQGFQAFISLMEKYRPRFFLHGHVHKSYGRQHKRYDKYLDTHVINAFDRCVFDYEDENLNENFIVFKQIAFLLLESAYAMPKITAIPIIPTNLSILIPLFFI